MYLTFGCILFLVACLVYSNIAVAADSPPPLRLVPVQVDILQDKGAQLKQQAAYILESEAPEFGGISGICVYPEKKTLLAVSDRGYFIRMSADFDLTGKITNMDLAGITPLTPYDSADAVDPRLFDSEALACIDNKVYVGFEQISRIWTYNLDDLSARPVPVMLPDPVGSLSGNTSIESIAMPPDYRDRPGLIVVPEYSGKDNPHRLWWIPVGPDQSIKRKFTQLATDKDYMATDAVFGPDGKLYVLERKVQLPQGFSIRLRVYEWPASSMDISDQHIIAGTTLVEFTSNQGIDNMEALSVLQSPTDKNELNIIMMSDDNYLWLQDTLLLQLITPEFITNKTLQ